MSKWRCKNRIKKPLRDRACNWAMGHTPLWELAGSVHIDTAKTSVMDAFEAGYFAAKADMRRAAK